MLRLDVAGGFLGMIRDGESESRSRTLVKISR
jgi:hypothetical protein